MNQAILFKVAFMLFFIGLQIHVESKIRMHIVPHTHDDVGWGSTFEEYYTTGINGNCVKCILDSMVQTLSGHPERTYTYVEMAFFERWYNNLNDDIKNQVKSFIKAGQLEFINGAWSMNDEATPTFQDIIDNFRLGLNFLKTEFNYTPKVAWSIDPFGHSRTQAAILAELGFENFVFCRIDFREKEWRRDNQKLQFNWYPYENSDVQIFTHITFHDYVLNWPFPDMLSNENFKNPDKFNKPEIYTGIKNIRSYFATDEVMLLVGADFSFKYPNNGFTNFDSLIKAFNEDSNYNTEVEFLYSTPSRYFRDVKKALRERKEGILVEKGIDFFPYSDRTWDYWTGFYTSRPFLKGRIREAVAYLQASSRFTIDYLYAFTHDFSADNSGTFKIMPFNYIRRMHGINMHHDAITGTSYDYVAKDYIRKMADGIEKVKSTIKKNIRNIMNDDNLALGEVCVLSKTSSCENNQISAPDLLNRKTLSIAVFNSHDSSSVKFDKVYVYLKDFSGTDHKISITDQDGDIVPYSAFGKDEDLSVTELIIFVNRNKLKTVTYVFVSITTKDNDTSQDKNVATEIQLDSTGLTTIINTDYVKVDYLSTDQSFIHSVLKNNSQYTYKVSHNFFTYNENQDPARRYRSATYLMAVSQKESIPFSFSYCQVYSTQEMVKVILKFSDSTISLRFYTSQINESIDLSDFVEMESTINPNMRKQNDGFEFLLKVESGKIDNTNTDGNTEFYTDTNSRHAKKRVKNYRESLQYDLEDDIVSNFYPINNFISIVDSKSKGKLSVFNDRSQAGTSLYKGVIYLTLNRWGLHDDEKGLGWGTLLEEESSNSYFKLNHYIVLGDNTKTVYYVNKLINNKNLTFQLYFQNDFFPTVKNSITNAVKPSFNYVKIFTPDCITINYYFRFTYEVIIQFLNESLPYFGDSKSSCLFQISAIETDDYYTTLSEVKINTVDIVKAGIDSQIVNLKQGEFKAYKITYFKK